MPKRKFLLLGLMLLCLAVRLPFCWRDSLWDDEVSSIAAATGHSLDIVDARIADVSQGDLVYKQIPQPIDVFERSTRHDQPPAPFPRIIRGLLLTDVHPPFYFGSLYFWTLIFGSSDFVLRLFSAVLSVLCVPVLWQLTGMVAGRRAALFACLLFIFSPWSIIYGTEVRPYEMLGLLALCNTLLALMLHKSGFVGGKRWLIRTSWILTAACGMLTHYFFVFPFAAVVFWLMLYPGKVRRMDIFVSLVALVGLVFPWFSHLPELANHSSGQWIKGFPGWGTVLKAPLANFLSFFYLENKFARIAMDAAVLSVLALACKKLRLRAVSVHKQLLLLVIVAACVGPIAFDLARNTSTCAVTRYAFAGIAMAYAFLGVSFAYLGRRLAVILMTCILLLFSADYVVSFFDASTGRQKNSFRDLAGYLREKPVSLVILQMTEAGMTSACRYLPSETTVLPWSPSTKNDMQLLDQELPKYPTVALIVRKDFSDRQLMEKLKSVMVYEGEPAAWTQSHANDQIRLMIFSRKR